MMWFIGLILALPLLLGVAICGKRFHGFLRHRGMDSKKAATTAVVSMVLLVGVMASPWILPFGALRVAVWIFYLYFLYVGASEIVYFFIGHPEEKVKADPKPSHDDDHDCGCDHSGHGHSGQGHSHDEAAPNKNGKPDVKKDDKNDGDGEQTNWDKFRPQTRDPRDIRDELQRRRNEQQ